MSSKVTVELSDTTELPTPQVEGWLDANDDGKLTASEKLRFSRSGAKWTATHESNSGQLVIRVLAPLGSKAKVSVTDADDATRKRFGGTSTISQRPMWIVGLLK